MRSGVWVPVVVGLMLALLAAASALFMLDALVEGSWGFGVAFGVIAAVFGNAARWYLGEASRAMSDHRDEAG